ncbi:MAG: hypothetical protein AABX28_02595, partial [Nanoarchaeota archaeon]
DLIDENERRKISATLQSRKYNFVVVSLKDILDMDERLRVNKKDMTYSLTSSGVGGRGIGGLGIDSGMEIGIENSLNELKEKIFKSFDKIRIYTKHPGKEGKHADKPVILEKDSSVKTLAEKLFHSSSNVKETFITGPSSKFPRQKVGLSHKLKDLDVVEFKTK